MARSRPAFDAQPVGRSWHHLFSGGWHIGTIEERKDLFFYRVSLFARLFDHLGRFFTRRSSWTGGHGTEP